MNKSVIVYGRHDWGMANHAERMRKHFNLEHVVVNFDGKHHEAEGYLYIAYCYLPGATPPTMRVMAFEEVAQQINDAIPRTQWLSIDDNPVRIGVYELRVAKAPEDRPHWSKWDKWWRFTCRNASDAAAQVCRSDNVYSGVNDAWRGLAEEPIVVA